jgi:hypothetical protein
LIEVKIMDPSVVVFKTIVQVGLMVLFARGGYRMAGRRNRDQVKWAIICMLTGFVGVGILYFFKPVPVEESEAAEPRFVTEAPAPVVRRCRVCVEFLKPADRFCANCGAGVAAAVQATV